MKSKGWQKESTRHSLARKGVQTSLEGKVSHKNPKYASEMTWMQLSQDSRNVLEQDCITEEKWDNMTPEQKKDVWGDAWIHWDDAIREYREERSG
jgi:hypothetical protein